jgi:GxxExxY protein
MAPALRLGDFALSENEISRHIVACAIEAHRTLGGPGLLESIYEQALIGELKKRNLPVSGQVRLPILYKGHAMEPHLRIDLVVGTKVTVECKATTAFNSIFEAQVLTYLRVASLKLGLIINFGERLERNKPTASGRATLAG